MLIKPFSITECVKMPILKVSEVEKNEDGPLYLVNDFQETFVMELSV